MRNGGCWRCNGRGGFHGPDGWRPCSCRRPTREQLAAQRAMNAPRGWAGVPLRGQLSIFDVLNANDPEPSDSRSEARGRDAKRKGGPHV